MIDYQLLILPVNQRQSKAGLHGMWMVNLWLFLPHFC